MSSTNKLTSCIQQVHGLLDQGIYDQHDLFDRVYKANRTTHYATVRRAIHIAKSSIIKEI